MMNKVAEEILGLKVKDMIGRELTRLPLEDEQGHPIPIKKGPAATALVTGKTVKVTCFFTRKDKTRFPIAITATPIRQRGETTGFIEIIRDITQELEIDRSKSEFVSLASHQLRTPLGIMKWYIEALVGEDYYNKAPDSTRKYFDEVYKANERVLGLVRDLLSVSRIDQQRVKNTPQQLDPVGQIEAVIEQMQILANKRKVELLLDVPAKKAPPITIDALQFREVIENLVVNAIEYSRDGGRVYVKVGKQNGILSISVADNGIGISREDRKKLFTKFFRSAKSAEYNPEGVGLGLYVVKSYVEGWGGSVSVKSAEGEGSTFTINLPLRTKMNVQRSKGVRKDEKDINS